MILLFLTIVLWFSSVITLADINILSDINNAWQTIGRITITNDGTSNGTTRFDFNYLNGKTYVNTTGGGITAAPGNFAGKVLGVDNQWNLIYAYTTNLVVSWGVTGETVIVPSSDEDWMIAGNDMYSIPQGNVGIGTAIMDGKLHVKGSWDTDIYIEETVAGNAASLRLETPVETWIAWWDSNPNVFFIGALGHQEYFTINPLGNVGIGTINPQERLEINGGNVRISNLSNKVVLGTNASGTIIGSTSGSIYNLISWFIETIQWPQGNTWATWAQWATWPAWTWIWDNLWNHIATLNLNMMWLWIKNLWSWSWLLQNCSPTEAWTVKFEDSCFQWCDGATWIVLWWTCDTWLPIVCWNGVVQTGELCDDGNIANNDGCTSLCQRETNPIPQACTSLPANTLPNTAINVTQTCNTSNGSTCTSWLPSLTYTYNITPSTTQCYYKCSTWYTWSWSISTCVLNVACWNGVVQTGELCDDGNITNNDGCTSSCQRETRTGTCWSIPANTIANTVTQIPQTCSVSNGTTCQLRMPSNLTPSYNPVPSTTACQYTCASWYTWSWSISTCVLNVSCWNGVVEKSAEEECDDGNITNNDGCTSSCQRETKNEACLSLPVNAIANTATGILQTCWDSNGTLCTLWTPINIYAYNTTPSTSSCNYICAPWYTLSWGSCVLNIACWNGVVQTGELCDDGNITNNDGCTSSCQREMPQCSFTMNPTSWNLPLEVMFNGIEQNRAIYSLNFGDFIGINNVSSFSGTTHEYKTIWTFIPVLTATNQYNITSTINCYATWWTTWIVINSSCGRWLSLRWSTSCTRWK